MLLIFVDNGIQMEWMSILQKSFKVNSNKCWLLKWRTSYVGRSKKEANRRPYSSGYLTFSATTPPHLQLCRQCPVQSCWAMSVCMDTTWPHTVTHTRASECGSFLVCSLTDTHTCTPAIYSYVCLLEWQQNQPQRRTNISRISSSKCLSIYKTSSIT